MKFLLENSTLAMWLANMNWLGVFGKKLAGVKIWVFVKKSIFRGNYPWGEGGCGGSCGNFLRELNPAYVVGKYELARCVG